MDVVGSESSVLEVVFALVPVQSAPLSRALFQPCSRQYYSRGFQFRPARTWEDYSASTARPDAAMTRATSRGSEEPSLLDSLRNALKSCTI